MVRRLQCQRWRFGAARSSATFEPEALHGQADALAEVVLELWPVLAEPMAPVELAARVSSKDDDLKRLARRRDNRGQQRVSDTGAVRPFGNEDAYRADIALGVAVGHRADDVTVEHRHEVAVPRVRQHPAVMSQVAVGRRQHSQLVLKHRLRDPCFRMQVPGTPRVLA